jgi:microcystin-dependent protein
LTGHAVIQFTLPGFYIVDNRCTNTNTWVVQLQSAIGTTSIGYVCAPPGQKVQVFHDGTSMDYVNLGIVGESVDLVAMGALPIWMAASVPTPYLIKDGTIYNVATYPALGARLGATFGGNGVTTFAVPDERARVRVGFDPNLTGRMNVVINASTMGAAGGDQNLQFHGHTVVVSDPGHGHTGNATYGGGAVNGGFGGGGVFVGGVAVPIVVDAALTGITASASGAGGGASQNVQPSIISTLPVIKT